MTNPSSLATAPGVRVHYESLLEAFPEVNPQCIPYGDRVLVQMRTPKKRTAGGIEIPNESRETELWNTQVAKVITLGPVAFCNRDTLDPWPEGNWCQPGTYVRVAKYGGDRWEVPVPGTNSEKALFVFFKDHDIIGEVPEEYVLDMVAFL